MVTPLGAANADLRCAGDLERSKGATMPVWVMPQDAPCKLRAKMWLDCRNDVKASDVELAAREGYAGVEHAKRYMTLGMAGRLDPWQDHRQGADAGRFLDMMSTLPAGKCRYGLMCNANGFLMDDGGVARPSTYTWLCHTTTGRADRIHGHMEDRLQCEWWDWQVHTANLTEQFARIAVAGPKARELLQRLPGSIDLSQEALPFMQGATGALAGIPARVHRISFSGELSHGIALPANRGLELWETLHDLGRDLGINPLWDRGDACHACRKGLHHDRVKTDGTVIPQDLGLHWAISGKKPACIGKRAQARSFMKDGAAGSLWGWKAWTAASCPTAPMRSNPG